MRYFLLPPITEILYDQPHALSVAKHFRLDIWDVYMAALDQLTIPTNGTLMFEALWASLRHVIETDNQEALDDLGEDYTPTMEYRIWVEYADTMKRDLFTLYTTVYNSLLRLTSMYDLRQYLKIPLVVDVRPHENYTAILFYESEYEKRSVHASQLHRTSGVL